MTNHNDNGNHNGNNDSGKGDYNDEPITEAEPLRKLFIGGLDYRTTDEGLKAHFEKWGKVVDVVVMKDPRTKRSRGFGFITYTNSSMIDNAQNARPHKIDGRIVEPKRAVPRQDINNPHSGATVKKLFVGGLRDDHDDQCLRDYFGDFGNIVDVNIVIDKETGKKRGFAFIEYDDYDPVDKIVLHKTHNIKGKSLDVKKALPKQEMGGRQQQGGRGGNMGRGNMGGNMGGGMMGNNQNGWGGNSRGGNDNWGGNNFGGGGGGGYNNGGNGGGGGGWGGNNMGPWDSGNNGGGSWNNGPGFGGPGGNGPANNGNWGNDFGGGGGGGGYQQGYGGGPQRGNFGNNRMQPYSNNGNFGNNKMGNQGGNFGGNQGNFGGPNAMGGGGGGGGGNRRY